MVKIKFKVIKDHPTVDGMLYKNEVVTVDEIYKSFVNQEKISLEKVVEKMCHNPAICFQVKNRGFIREGYFADLVLVDLDNPWEVAKDNILYKCGWSPFEGTTFKSRVSHTFVNGILTYHNLKFPNKSVPQRLTFNRS